MWELLWKWAQMFPFGPFPLNVSASLVFQKTPSWPLGTYLMKERAPFGPRCRVPRRTATAPTWPPPPRASPWKRSRTSWKHRYRLRWDEMEMWCTNFPKHRDGDGLRSGSHRCRWLGAFVLVGREQQTGGIHTLRPGKSHDNLSKENWGYFKIIICRMLALCNSHL